MLNFLFFGRYLLGFGVTFLLRLIWFWLFDIFLMFGWLKEMCENVAVVNTEHFKVQNSTCHCKAASHPLCHRGTAAQFTSPRAAHTGAGICSSKPHLYFKAQLRANPTPLSKKSRCEHWPVNLKWKPSVKISSLGGAAVVSAWPCPPTSVRNVHQRLHQQHANIQYSGLFSPEVSPWLAQPFPHLQCRVCAAHRAAPKLLLHTRSQHMSISQNQICSN